MVARSDVPDDELSSSRHNGVNDNLESAQIINSDRLMKRSFLLGIRKRLIQPGSLSTIKGGDSGAEQIGYS